MIAPSLEDLGEDLGVTPPCFSLYFKGFLMLSSSVHPKAQKDTELCSCFDFCSFALIKKNLNSSSPAETHLQDMKHTHRYWKCNFLHFKLSLQHSLGVKRAIA